MACDAAWLGWGLHLKMATSAKFWRMVALPFSPPDQKQWLPSDKIEAKHVAEANDVPVAPWAIVETANKPKNMQSHWLSPIAQGCRWRWRQGIRLVERDET